MRLPVTFFAIIACLSLSGLFPSSAASMDDPGFTIKRMVVCKNIEAREPVGVGDTFTADTGRVYVFLEANAIEYDTTVNFVWYHGEEEMARVSLPLIKGRRWRTYASKKLGDLKGAWKVELLDASGIVINTVSFRVQ